MPQGAQGRHVPHLLRVERTWAHEDHGAIRRQHAAERHRLVAHYRADHCSGSCRRRHAIRPFACVGLTCGAPCKRGLESLEHSRGAAHDAHRAGGRPEPCTGALSGALSEGVGHIQGEGGHQLGLERALHRFKRGQRQLDGEASPLVSQRGVERAQHAGQRGARCLWHGIGPRFVRFCVVGCPSSAAATALSSCGRLRRGAGTRARACARGAGEAARARGQSI